nr:MAG TPA: hypothetical protein [Inoviridae sp.]
MNIRSPLEKSQDLAQHAKAEGRTEQSNARPDLEHTEEIENIPAHPGERRLQARTGEKRRRRDRHHQASQRLEEQISRRNQGIPDEVPQRREDRREHPVNPRGKRAQRIDDWIEAHRKAIRKAAQAATASTTAPARAYKVVAVDEQKNDEESSATGRHCDAATAQCGQEAPAIDTVKNPVAAMYQGAPFTVLAKLFSTPAQVCERLVYKVPLAPPKVAVVVCAGVSGLVSLLVCVVVVPVVVVFVPSLAASVTAVCILTGFVF